MNGLLLLILIAFAALLLFWSSATVSEGDAPMREPAGTVVIIERSTPAATPRP